MGLPCWGPAAHARLSCSLAARVAVTSRSLTRKASHTGRAPGAGAHSRGHSGRLGVLAGGDVSELHTGHLSPCPPALRPLPDGSQVPAASPLGPPGLPVPGSESQGPLGLHVQPVRLACDPAWPLGCDLVICCDPISLRGPRSGAHLLVRATVHSLGQQRDIPEGAGLPARVAAVLFISVSLNLLFLKIPNLTLD